MGSDIAILEIDLNAVKQNYSKLRSIAKNALVVPVVKANAYGLGATQIAHALTFCDANIFFVSRIEEAFELRKIQSDRPLKILVLNGVFKNNLEDFYEHGFIPVLNDYHQAGLWSNYAKEKQKKLPAVLHFDTGLHRYGIMDNEIEKVISDEILSSLYIKCIMSHLAASEEVDNIYNDRQIVNFKNICNYFPNKKASLANSSGIFLNEDFHFDIVRPGKALYGLNPILDKNPMYNVVTLKAPIIQIKTVGQGSVIGYNLSATTVTDSVIATLPIGYADGYNWSLSNSGFVYIDTYKAKVIGRVSMDLLNIDVTNVPSHLVYLGKYVEIIGPNVSIDSLADIAKTSSYTFLTSIGNRYKKVYKNDIEIM